MSTYMYAIVDGARPLTLEGRTGVGKPGGELRRIDAEGLTAVVSDAPADLRGKRRDLLAHEQILEDLCQQGSVLPMRFGLVADDDASIRSNLESERSRYTRMLAALDGRVELNVKAAHQEDEALRALLSESSELRELNEELKKAGGGTYEQRLQFGEKVAEALRRREERDAAQFVTRLRAHAVDDREAPAVQGSFLNMSFLVERDHVETFTSAVDELATATDGFVELTVQGPLPPYSFSELTDAA